MCNSAQVCLGTVLLRSYVPCALPNGWHLRIFERCTCQHRESPRTHLPTHADQKSALAMLSNSVRACQQGLKCATRPLSASVLLSTSCKSPISFTPFRDTGVATHPSNGGHCITEAGQVVLLRASLDGVCRLGLEDLVGLQVACTLLPAAPMMSPGAGSPDLQIRSRTIIPGCQVPGIEPEPSLRVLGSQQDAEHWIDEGRASALRPASLQTSP